MMLGLALAPRSQVCTLGCSGADGAGSVVDQSRRRCPKDGTIHDRSSNTACHARPEGSVCSQPHRWPAPGAFDLDQRDFGFFGGSRLLFTMGWSAKSDSIPLLSPCGCSRIVNNQRRKIGGTRGIVLSWVSWRSDISIVDLLLALKARGLSAERGNYRDTERHRLVTDPHAPDQSVTLRPKTWFRSEGHRAANTYWRSGLNEVCHSNLMLPCGVMKHYQRHGFRCRLPQYARSDVGVRCSALEAIPSATQEARQPIHEFHACPPCSAEQSAGHGAALVVGSVSSPSPKRIQ